MRSGNGSLRTRPMLLTLGIAVVGDFVAGPVAERPTDIGVVGGVGTESVSRRPVSAVVVIRDGRVVAGEQRENPGLRESVMTNICGVWTAGRRT